MMPWRADVDKKIFVLHEPGKQILVYAGGSVAELDLSTESGLLRVNTVNPKTGEVTVGGTIQAGALVKLPDAPVIWLVKE